MQTVDQEQQTEDRGWEEFILTPDEFSAISQGLNELEDQKESLSQETQALLEVTNALFGFCVVLLQKMGARIEFVEDHGLEENEGTEGVN